MICNKGYSINKQSKNKKSYRVWLSMIYRCYGKNIRPYYKNCNVCNEWLCYENFEKWFNENYYEIDNEIVALDKDIFSCENKIYSPNTCIFVPQRINSAFVMKSYITKIKQIK